MSSVILPVFLLLMLNCLVFDEAHFLASSQLVEMVGALSIRRSDGITVWRASLRDHEGLADRATLIGSCARYLRLIEVLLMQNT